MLHPLCSRSYKGWQRLDWVPSSPSRLPRCCVSAGKAVKAFFGFPVVLKKMQPSQKERDTCIELVTGSWSAGCLFVFMAFPSWRCAVQHRRKRWEEDRGLRNSCRKKAKQEREEVSGTSPKHRLPWSDRWMRNCPEMVMEPRTGGITAFCSSAGGVS